MDNFGVLLAFILYLGLMLGIGFYFSKASKNMSDYFLGGRKVGSWLTALSAQASDMSGWLLMGLPGAIYLSGLSEAWLAIGLGIGTYLNWLLVAKRLRKYSVATGDSITIPQYFQNRFNANSKSVRVVCAIIIFVFFLIYTASGFNAAAKLLESTFGVDYRLGLTIGALVIMVYTFLGGYFAVVWTDFLQGMLMFVALLIVPIIAYNLLQVDIKDAIGPELVENGYLSLVSVPKDGVKTAVSWQSVVSNLGWGLGYFGMPHILVRFMGIKSADLIKKSRIIAVIWVAVTLIASVCVGFVGYAYFTSKGIFLEGAASETVFIELIKDIVPGFVGGILLCSIISAIMSTSDSQLLVTASAVSNDIYQTIFRKEATNKELLLVSKVAVVIVSLIAYVIALNPENTVMGLVSYAWAGFGGAFGPAMILSLYWKRMTMRGALAGMISGGLTVIIWNTFLAGPTGIYELVPAFAISLIFIIVFSLSDKEPSKEVIETFEKVDSINI